MLYRFLRALQRNRAQSRLLYLLIVKDRHYFSSFTKKIIENFFIYCLAWHNKYIAIDSLTLINQRQRLSSPFHALKTARLPKSRKNIEIERIVGNNKSAGIWCLTLVRLVNFSFRDRIATTSAEILTKYSWKETWIIFRTSQSQEVLLELIRSIIHHGIYYHAIHWPICYLYKTNPSLWISQQIQLWIV